MIGNFKLYLSSKRYSINGPLKMNEGSPGRYRSYCILISSLV